MKNLMTLILTGLAVTSFALADEATPSNGAPVGVKNVKTLKKAKKGKKKAAKKQEPAPASSPEAK